MTDETYDTSSIPAHALHCLQLASNSALASSSVAVRLWVRRIRLLGACSAQNQAQKLGAGAGLIDAPDAPFAAEDA